jgi:hypothetical protein
VTLNREVIVWLGRRDVEVAGLELSEAIDSAGFTIALDLEKKLKIRNF